MGYLGNFNGTHWYHVEGATEPSESWPVAQQTIFGMVTLIDSGVIEYSLPTGQVVATYASSDEEPPGCI